MTWSRRLVLGGGISMTGAMFVSTSGGARPDRPAIAKTVHGQLQSATERGVCVFRGVPYGGSVSGPNRRFKTAPPPPSWTGVRDATRYGAPAIQPPGFPGEPAPAEDCLFLNVWTPSLDRRRRPVMFYSHGGGFTIGSGSRPWQNGANLARQHDVVVVESNHRLGALGYLYLGELLGPEYQGNQGLLDLVAALKWVNENITAFGGDPNNVMIFGESGGGGKTACLYTMPSAAPYFSKASLESPVGPGNRSPAEATEVAREAMRDLGLSDPRKLLEISASELLKFQMGGAKSAAPGTRKDGRNANQRDQMFWPFIDGRILPESPFRNGAPSVARHKPLIVGGCKDESVFFSMGDAAAFSMNEESLRDRVAAVVGDRAQDWINAFRKSRPDASPSQLYFAITTATPWRAHAVHIAEERARQGGAPVYSYILQYQSPANVPGTNYASGSPHASDINTKFDNVGPQPGDPPGPPPPGPFGDASPGKRQTAANMSAMWAAFARNGNPSIPGQPRWKPYTLAKRETMLIDAQCTLVPDPEGAERRFWQSQPDPERVV